MSGSSKSTAKQRRLQELEAAQGRLHERGESITITAVAREAGVTPSLIHNTYPDLAERIRKLQGKSVRAQVDDLHRELNQARADNQALRAETETAVLDARKLASMLEALRFELARHKGVAEGTVAPFRSSSET